jgi:hypothetical protein
MRKRLSKYTYATASSRKSQRPLKWFVFFIASSLFGNMGKL